MNSIAFDVENEKRFSTRIQKFFRRYQVSSILKKCNAYKEQGFSVVALVQYLFCRSSATAVCFWICSLKRGRNSERIRFTV